MKKYNSMYLGICVNNDDPQKRGRVQVFVPHIMPTLYENWNEIGQDINITVTGDNMVQGLNSDIVFRLAQILPWAEAASPILGQSTTGNLVAEGAGAGGGTYQGKPGSNTGDYYEQSPTADPSGVQPIQGTYSGGGNVIEAQGTEAATRKGRLSNRLRGVLERGLEGTGLSFKVYSGGQRMEGAPGAVGSHRHDDGNAADGDFIDTATGRTLNPVSNPEDKARISDALSRLGAAGIQGCGWDDHGYMGQCRFHLDVSGAGNWGSSKTSATASPWVMSALEKGRRGDIALTSYSGLETNNSSGESAAASPHKTADPVIQDKSNPLYGTLADPETDNTSTRSVAGGGDAAGGGSGGAGGGGSYGIPSINRSDVKTTGATLNRGVSTYGSIYDDWTSFLDVKASERPPEAQAYWANKGYNVAKGEAQLRSKYPGWYPKLSLANTGQGKYVGNIVPGFDVGVAKSYGYKPGQMLYITNSAGQPVGPNGGYFRVGDTGGGSLADRNALDFYTGKDQGLKDYFGGMLNANLQVTPVDVTGSSGAALNAALQNVPNYALQGESINSDISGLAGAAPGAAPGAPSVSMPSGMVNKTDPHGATMSLNNNDMAKGLFCYPAAGSMLWVFFREGNPLHPVYFAVSYSQAEWSSAYRSGGSDAPGYKPGSTPDNSVTSTGGIMNLNGVGGIRWEDTNNPTDRLLDEKSIQFFGEDGSNIFFAKGFNQYYTKYDRRDKVEGDRWETTLGFREDWTQGDHNIVCMGDFIIKVGNCTPAAVEAVKKIQDKIKEIQAPLSETTV